MVLTEKWPVIGRHEQAAVWLQIWTDLGRAPRTIDAYARGLAEYLMACEREDVDPERLVPVRLFYDLLMEEGLRESNPEGRGRYTPAAGRVAGSAA
jgi:integrase/recombinase XerD